MKLYTEEQVKETIKLSRNVYKEGYPLTIEEILKKLTPIQLPSDEEIEKAGYHCENKDCFIDGADWMKEQILNQNK